MCILFAIFHALQHIFANEKSEYSEFQTISNILWDYINDKAAFV